MLGGVTAYHLRILAESPWNGGGGYSFAEIGQMTLDQIWARLCDINILKREVGERTQKLDGLAATSKIANPEGGMKARSSEGDELVLKKSSASKAKMLRDGTYEGYVINASTGQREYRSPNKRRERIKNRELQRQEKAKEQ